MITRWTWPFFEFTHELYLLQRCKIDTWLLWYTCGKSYKGVPNLPWSLTLNDLERSRELKITYIGQMVWAIQPWLLLNTCQIEPRQLGPSQWHWQERRHVGWGECAPKCSHLSRSRASCIKLYLEIAMLLFWLICVDMCRSWMMAVVWVWSKSKTRSDRWKPFF